jgi:hypothetical protein
MKRFYKTMLLLVVGVNIFTYESANTMVQPEICADITDSHEVAGRTQLNDAAKRQRKRFTPEEDARLVIRRQELGPKWEIIANSFPGRSIDSVKNHYYSIMKKQKKQLESEFHNTFLEHREQDSLETRNPPSFDLSIDERFWDLDEGEARFDSWPFSVEEGTDSWGWDWLLEEGEGDLSPYFI